MLEAFVGVLELCQFLLLPVWTVALYRPPRPPRPAHASAPMARSVPHCLGGPSPLITGPTTPSAITCEPGAPLESVRVISFLALSSPHASPSATTGREGRKIKAARGRGAAGHRLQPDQGQASASSGGRGDQSCVSCGWLDHLADDRAWEAGAPWDAVSALRGAMKCCRTAADMRPKLRSAPARRGAPRRAPVAAARAGCPPNAAPARSIL